MRRSETQAAGTAHAVLLAGVMLGTAACSGSGDPGGAPEKDGSGGLVQKTITLEGTSHPYAVWVPPGWPGGREWPVVLFLHGSVERGEDGRKPTQAGIGPALEKNPGAWPAVVAMPQCASGLWWGNPAMEALALAVLDRTVEEYRGDRSRLILTGKSMGGNGVWRLGAAHAGTFSCLVPVCGFIHFEGAPQPKTYGGGGAGPEPDYYAEAARAIGKTPVWIFHGEADESVPVTESRKMRDALKAAGGNVRMTEYPGDGHVIWDRVYAEPELPRWMLAQKRSGS